MTQEVAVRVIPSVKCLFCKEMAVSGWATCLQHGAELDEIRHREHPSEKYLFMGVLPHRQRRYWPDGKGQRSDG